MAPVIMVNDATYGNISVQQTAAVVEKYQAMD
jgi:NADH-quinone oxidoreductase subunit E